MFPHGVTWYIIKKRRINGGWHIPIARQLQVFFSTTNLLPITTKKQLGEAYMLLLKVLLFLSTLNVQYYDFITPLLYHYVTFGPVSYVRNLGTRKCTHPAAEGKSRRLSRHYKRPPNSHDCNLHAFHEKQVQVHKVPLGTPLGRYTPRARMCGP